MNKSDLRTGMKVVLRNGKNYIVFLGVRCFEESEEHDILLSDHSLSFMNLNSYNENLSCIGEKASDSQWDIIEVYIPDYFYSINQYFGINHRGSNREWGWKLINDDFLFVKVRILEQEIKRLKTLLENKNE